MAYDKKEMARNLKLLATTPKEIERQQQIYREKLAEIKAEEQKGIWGKATLDKRRQDALRERNTTCNALANRMRPALEYVRDNNNYSQSETINFSDPKLKDALRTIDYMGKDLSPADQTAMISSFAGDVGALRVLEKAFAKNGLYMKDAAREMQKPIPEQALREMGEVLAFQQYAESKGSFDFPIERAMWTRGAFQKQLDRLNLVDNDTDPYSAVLDAVSDKLRADMDSVDYSGMNEELAAVDKAKRQAELWKIKSAQQEMKKAQERGENPATVLNRELAKIKAADAAAQGAEANAK